MGLRTVATGAAAVGLIALALASPWSGGGRGPAGPPTGAIPDPPIPASPAGQPSSSVPSSPAPPSSLPPSSTGDVVTYDWPLHPEPDVVRGFEPPEQVWAPGHRGVDLAAAAGMPVHAAAGGVVAFAGRVVDRTVVSIDHADGIRTTYEPVDPVVQAGAQVPAGAVIGYLNQTDTGPHCAAECLHWGARTGPQDYLDPLLLLRAEPVLIRLYPLVP